MTTSIYFSLTAVAPLGLVPSWGLVYLRSLLILLGPVVTQNMCPLWQMVEK